MAILFDDTTDAENLHSLQGKVVELVASVQTTIAKEHTANGQHRDLTVDSLSSRTGAVVPVHSGIVWASGPELLTPPEAVITPPPLTAHTHNWAPQSVETARVIEITATAAVSLTGISVTGALRGQRRTLSLVNRSAFDLTLPSLSASSHEAHQFDFGGVAYVLTHGTTVDLYYDPTDTVWRGVSTPPATPAGPPLAHAPTHAAAGGDPVTLTTLAGYPGGTGTFLRADGTFAAPPTGGTPGPHHTAHEPGGADAIVGAAWLAQTNVFTLRQVINPATGSAALSLLTNAGVVDDRRFDVVVGAGGNISFQPLTDAGAADGPIVSIDRTAALNAPGGLASTPLNATNLTSGTVPAARLDPNLAYKNIDNSFVTQTLAPGTIVRGAGGAFYLFDTTAPAGNRMWRFAGLGDGRLRVQSLTDDASTVLASPFICHQVNGVVELPHSRLKFPLQPDDFDPDTLDCYAERTWTPFLTGGSGQSGVVYQFQVGTYVKIGQLVMLQYQINLQAGTFVGDVRIDGLPFRSTPVGLGTIATVAFGGLTLAISSLQCHVAQNQNYGFLQYVPAAGATGVSTLQGSHVGTTAYFIGNIVMRTAQ